MNYCRLIGLLAFGAINVCVPLLFLYAGLASAQEAAWPSRVIRLVVVFPPGGTSDLAARLIAPKLSSALGQQVIVENRPGASGIIGTELVAKSLPDGHVLIVSNLGAHSLAPIINKNARYDGMRDFTHIALLGSIPHVFLVHSGFPARSLAEFAALAKAQPGKLNYGTGGAGTINHVAGELLKLRLGIDITHVPSKSTAVTIVELRGLRIESAVDALPPNVGAIRKGELRALAILSGERSALAPEVPTAAELGFPDVRMENWIGISAPANLPAEIGRRMAAELEKVVQMQDIQDRLRDWGVTIMFKKHAEFTDFVRDDIAKWRSVIIASGVQVE